MTGLLLLLYLAAGLLLAYANDKLVVGDHTGGMVERAIYFVRATVAWPTYIAEDCIVVGSLLDGDNEDGDDETGLP